MNDWARHEYPHLVSYASALSDLAACAVRHRVDQRKYTGLVSVLSSIPMKATSPEDEGASDYKRLIYSESDRGAALVGATMIDDALGRLLHAYFDPSGRGIESVIKPLFDPMGPLGTFSGKARLAIAFRLIRREQYDDIQLIRKIRNEFAHNSAPADFSNLSVQRDMEKLNYARLIAKRIRRFRLVDSDTGRPMQIPDHELHADGYIKAGKSFFAVAVSWLLKDLEIARERVHAHREDLLDFAFYTPELVETMAESREAENLSSDDDVSLTASQAGAPSSVPWVLGATDTATATPGPLCVYAIGPITRTSSWNSPSFVDTSKLPVSAVRTPPETSRRDAHAGVFGCRPPRGTVGRSPSHALGDPANLLE